MGLPKVARVVGAICLYCVVSISVVFLNRHLFSSAFPYPVFVSWLQQLVGTICLRLLGYIGKINPRIAVIKHYPFDLRTAKKIAPFSLSFVGMIAFSNLCLKYVQVSTYQVARSLTLLFNLILSSYYLKLHISVYAWLSCGVVIVGLVVASFDSSTLTVAGLTLGVCSSIFQAVYTVGVKAALNYVDDDENELLVYNLGISSLLFLPAIFLSGESSSWVELIKASKSEQALRLWFSLVGSGVIGSTLTFSTYFCVRVTSPVTFNVTGYAKACLQSLGGIFLLGDRVTVPSLSGIALTLAGSAFYTKVKIDEIATASGSASSKEIAAASSACISVRRDSKSAVTPEVSTNAKSSPVSSFSRLAGDGGAVAVRLPTASSGGGRRLRLAEDDYLHTLEHGR